MDEFKLIEHYFARRSSAPGVVLGIGDDAAVLSIGAERQIVVTTDTVVEGVHFPANSPADKVGYRSCAVALSDIAAMGAEACWASLSLTVENADEDWLDGFVVGIDEALALDSVALIGGDTTRGPLTIGWHIIGSVAEGQAIRRSGATPGEDIFVSGQLGAAAAALAYLEGATAIDESREALLERYWHPQPRLALGRSILPYATSCIDVSDGLLADLGHLAACSQCGMRIWFGEIPVHPAITDRSVSASLDLGLTGGDDYELCFTASKQHRSAIERIASVLDLAITRIGETTQDSGITVIDSNGRTVSTAATGFRHFR